METTNTSQEVQSDFGKMIYLITASVRLDNLFTVKQSIKESCKKDYLDFKWILIFDLDTLTEFEHWKLLDEPWIEHYFFKTNGIGGHPQRNWAYDNLKLDGYIFALDDDTLLHPNFFTVLREIIKTTQKKGIIFAQVLPDKTIRINNADNIKTCQIDNGQFLIHRSIIDPYRYGNYQNGDGDFIQAIHDSHREDFIYLFEDLSYYNLLR